MIETPLITNKLNAPDPTMLLGPSSPASPPRFLRASITESKISGADEPSAIKVKLAMVGFQTGTCKVKTFPSLSYTCTSLVDDVMISIASMKMSAITEIPRKSHNRKMRYKIPRVLLPIKDVPGTLSMLL